MPLRILASINPLTFIDALQIMHWLWIEIEEEEREKEEAEEEEEEEEGEKPGFKNSLFSLENLTF